MSKVRSIFGRPHGDRLGCGFLSRRDVDEILEGKLDISRRERFERHQREGCTECAYLGVALEQFTRLLTDGVLGVEAGQFAQTEHGLKVKLREEFRRLAGKHGLPLGSLPWAHEMSTDDLEHIAAAGPEGLRKPPERDLDPDDDATCH